MELFEIQKRASLTVDELLRITGKINGLIEGYQENPGTEIQLRIKFLSARCKELESEFMDIQDQLDTVPAAELSPEKATSLCVTKHLVAQNKTILKEKQQILLYFEKHADITQSQLRASKLLERENDIRQLRAALNNTK